MKTEEKCMLNEEPFYQCCCTCIYLRPVHYHCCTEPGPSKEEKLAAGSDGRCVCSIRKGFACVLPEMERVYDNWPQHSVGCECHLTAEQVEAWKTKPSDPVVAFEETIKAFV